MFRSLILGCLASGLLLCIDRSNAAAAEVNTDVVQNAVFYQTSQDGATVLPVQYWRHGGYYRHYYRPYYGYGYRTHLHYRPWAYRYPSPYYGPGPWYGRGYYGYGPGVYFGFRY